MSLLELKRLYPEAYAQLVDGFDNDEDLASTDIELFLVDGVELHSRSRDEGTHNIWDPVTKIWYDV